MGTRVRLLLAMPLGLGLAVLSWRHSFAHLNYDISTGFGLIAVVSFALIMLLELPRNKINLVGWLFLLPLICTILFSWGELANEFAPDNGSKGWGYLWAISHYTVSFAATVIAAAIRFLLHPVRQSNKPSN